MTLETQKQMIVLPLPLSLNPSAWARLAAPFPLTQEEWDMMMVVLETMRPGLVSPPADAADGGAP